MGVTTKWVVYFMDNPTQLDDFGVALCQETTIFIYIWCYLIILRFGSHLAQSSFREFLWVFFSVLAIDTNLWQSSLAIDHIRACKWTISDLVLSRCLSIR